MTLLITGIHGLVGQYLVRILSQWQGKIVITGKGPCRLPPEWMGKMVYETMDITDPMAISVVFQQHRPDMVIHAAAMAQPDQCELNKPAADLVNIEATRYLLDAAEASEAFFVYLSTDFVFSGNSGPYTEASETGPINYYGLTKLRSEEAVQAYPHGWAIIRTVLVYGNTLVGTRTNIISWVDGELSQHKPIKVVGDQVRTPTYAGDLASAILHIATTRASGIWHIAGKDVLTPHDIAIMVADRRGYDRSLITKVDASVFTQPAVRPLETPFIIEKASKRLGYEPLSFLEGMEKLMNEG
jgi:dTDP-4-dehydrorhamnose reductase